MSNRRVGTAEALARFSAASRAGRRDVDRREPPVSQFGSDKAESLVGAAGEASQGIEGGAHVSLASVGEHTFGPLDDDPCVERRLQLFGDQQDAVC